MNAPPTPDLLLSRARRLGPLPYSELPPSGPWLAGAELAEWEADAADRIWLDLGRPDPYPLVEVGAGDGSRARAVLELGPQCLTALRLVLVEPGMEEDHGRLLPVDPPAFLFPAGAPDPDDPEAGPLPATGLGPLVTSVPDLPVLEGPATIVVMGWLSRLPSDRFEWRDGQWWEVRLAAADSGDLVDMLVPRESEGAPVPTAGARSGARVARLSGAVDWLGTALRTATSGVLAVVDRWTAATEPVQESASLSLDQLAAVRIPVDASPVELQDGLSVVRWRLG